MRTDIVVVMSPSAEDSLGMSETFKGPFVQALVTQSAVEALDEAVCCGLPGAM